MPCDRSCEENPDCPGWSLCQDNLCIPKPPPQVACCCSPGACCTPGGCEDGVPYIDCVSKCGEWRGPGSTCPADCPPACEGECFDNADCGCGCSCVNGVCVTTPCLSCKEPTQWRIVDDSARIYAQGDVVNNELIDLPSPWSPLFYWSSGTINLTLEVNGCGAGWDPLESWTVDVILCDTEAERYPEWPLPGPWAPPVGCDCAYDNVTDEVTDPCVPCPALTAVSGDGQAWRNPPHTVGVTFTGAVDGEWTNLLNWEDANGLSPAASLPVAGTNVSVAANVTSSAVSISVADLTIEAGAEFSVPATVAGLHCYGAIERLSTCEGQSGIVLCGGQAFFYAGSYNNGDVAYAEGQFYGDAENKSDGVLSGPTRFNDETVNAGLCNGPAEFWDTSDNSGVVESGSFFDEAQNSADVQGNASFENSSYNEGAVGGNATFGDTAENKEGGVVSLGATFSGASVNRGTVVLNATFTGTSINEASSVLESDAAFVGESINRGSFGGNATFGDSATNDGTVSGSATFSGSATNLGPVFGFATFNENATNDGGVLNGDAEFNGSAINSGGIVGSVTFNGTAVNAAAGLALANATFNADSINRGAVTGTATFNDDACNDGGTAGTFVPDPPPSC